MKCATVAALHSLIALASTHLVKYSVAVMMYLAPVHFLGGFMGPMKSMAHFSNACRVNCLNGLASGFKGILISPIVPLIPFISVNLVGNKS
jgi:hypothetical protein